MTNSICSTNDKELLTNMLRALLYQLRPQQALRALKNPQVHSPTEMQIKTAMTHNCFYFSHRQISSRTVSEGVGNGQPEQPSWSVSWRLPHFGKGINHGPEFPQRNVRRRCSCRVHRNTQKSILGIDLHTVKVAANNLICSSKGEWIIQTWTCTDTTPRQTRIQVHGELNALLSEPSSVT